MACVRHCVSAPLPWCRHSFATMSYIAETFIFIYLGMDALDWEKYDSISFRYAAPQVLSQLRPLSLTL